MRTSKPIATISYNSKEYLFSRCMELVRNHVVQFFAFVYHEPEADEKKAHIHLYIEPNRILDTMSLQEHFRELDPKKPDKPLGVIRFEPSSTDDWVLYTMHFKPYLTSKNQSRKYSYEPHEFFVSDQDTFDEMVFHATHSGNWAMQNLLMQTITQSPHSITDLLLKGAIPLQQAGNAYRLRDELMRTGTYRNGRNTHTPLCDPDGVINEFDQFEQDLKESCETD